MFKISLSLFLGLFAYAATAQITITSADMPSSNDTLRYSTGNLSGTMDSVYQISGANAVWDFSQLVATAQTVDTYKPSIQTPYAGFFFGANRYGKLEAETIGFGQFEFTDVYRFYKGSSSKFEVEGVGLKYSGFPIPSFYSDKDELYQFPLDYNDLDSSTFSYTLSLLTLGSLHTSGYRLNSVDGWGQITTPYGTFNALRVTTDIVSTDSISFGIINFGFPNHQREVKWLANGEAYPILQVSGAVVFGQFVPNTVTYRDSFRVVPTSPFAPVAAFDADNVLPFTSDTVTFTSNAFLASHDWSFSPNTVTFVRGTSSTSREPSVTFDVAGTYNVSLEVSNNFGTDDTTAIAFITAFSPSSTVDLAQTNGLKIYPNPTTDFLNLEYELEQQTEVCISLYDVQGRAVRVLMQETQAAGKQNMPFSLAGLNLVHGVYFVKIQLGEAVMWQKIFVQK